MVDSKNKISRRDTLKGIGAALGTAGVTSLSGCAGVLEDNDNSSGHSPSEGTEDTNSTDEPDSGPEYNEVVDVPGNADLTGSDSYSFVAGVERSEDGETEMLPGDSYEVKDAYVMRDPSVLDKPIFQSEIEATEPVYGDTEYVVENAYNGVEEIVREAGLYNDLLDELEVKSDGEINVPSDLMLPGKNRLYLEIEYDSDGENGEFTVDEQLQVEKSHNETLDQAWVEDQEMFSELRKMYRNGQALAGFPTSGVTWMDIVEDVDEIVNENYDMEGLDLSDRLQRTASHWILEAADAVGGPPSGQAAELGYTLEELEGVETTTIATSGHHTVLAYDRESDKTYHVETGSGGRTDFPPGKYNHASSNPEISPIWPEQGDQVELAKSCLIRVGSLAPLNSIRDEKNIGRETTITAMEKFREGTNQREMIDTLQSRGLSLVLSPSLDFKIEGDIEDVERSIEY